MVILACVLRLGGFLGLNCDPATYTGGRELRPPRAGIKVGSLYYVREEQTNDLSKPANLEPLCTTNLLKWGVVPSNQDTVSTISLTKKLKSSAELSVLDLQMAKAGISGSWDDYYSYDLKNAKHTGITLVEMDKVYKNRAFQDDCDGWRTNIENNGWAAYQIQSIYEGDVQIGISDEISVDADLMVKLRNFEPKVKAAIRRVIGATYDGKGVVAVFVPLPRK